MICRIMLLIKKEYNSYLQEGHSIVKVYIILKKWITIYNENIAYKVTINYDKSDDEDALF